MAPTPDQMKAGYHAMWERATVDPKSAAAATAVAKKILAHMGTYEAVEAQTRVPAPWIGPVHNRENSLTWDRHLHCGDPLTARTVHVPKGRPVKGHPPFTWMESAIDALTMPPHSLDKVPVWSIERALYEWEKYNGWGYLKRGNSPYLWAGTSEYHGGKYVADGKYSAAAWDKQLGCVAVLKAMIALDPKVGEKMLAVRQIGAPADVVAKGDEASRKARAVRNAGAAASAGGAGAQQLTEQPADLGPVQHVLPAVIGLGIAAALVAAFVIARKKKIIRDKFGG